MRDKKYRHGIRFVVLNSLGRPESGVTADEATLELVLSDLAALKIKILSLNVRWLPPQQIGCTHRQTRWPDRRYTSKQNLSASIERFRNKR